MNEFQKEFFDIVTQVRAHLELQRALGVSAVEIALPERSSQQSNAQKENPGGVKVNPSLPQGREGAAVQSSTLAAIREELADCKQCKLCTTRKTIVFGEGDPGAALVFIGGGPGQEEDGQGRPFAGAAGQLLTDIIVKGMKLKREDVYICTVVKCRIPENRDPEPDETAACEQFLIRQLRVIKPKILVALGDVTVKMLLKTREGIGTLHGKWQKYEGIPLMPTLHPADLLKNPSDKKAAWEDIKKVVAEMERKKSGVRS